MGKERYLLLITFKKTSIGFFFLIKKFIRKRYFGEEKNKNSPNTFSLIKDPIFFSSSKEMDCRRKGTNEPDTLWSRMLGLQSPVLVCHGQWLTPFTSYSSLQEPLLSSVFYHDIQREHLKSKLQKVIAKGSWSICFKSKACKTLLEIKTLLKKDKSTWLSDPSDFHFLSVWGFTEFSDKNNCGASCWQKR